MGPKVFVHPKITATLPFKGSFLRAEECWLETPAVLELMFLVPLISVGTLGVTGCLGETPSERNACCIPGEAILGIDATMRAVFEALRIEFTERSEKISAGR
jgi:hypothetical protein